MARTRLFTIAAGWLMAASLIPRISAQEAVKPSECCSIVVSAIEASVRVKPGSTRWEIEKEFSHDGGVSFRQDTVYVYKLCPSIKIRVLFARDPVEAGFEERPEIL